MSAAQRWQALLCSIANASPKDRQQYIERANAIEEFGTRIDSAGLEGGEFVFRCSEPHGARFAICNRRGRWVKANG